MNATNALVLLGSDIARFAVQQRDAWTWDEVALDASPSIEGIVERIAGALRAAGFTGGGLMLGVPATRCLAATFDSTDLPAGDYQTRLFRFEEQLPLSAEQIVAEFIDVDAAEGVHHTLGVAVERVWIERYVAAFESIGLAVDAVIPTTLLATGKDSLTANEAMLIAEPGDSQWQLILYASGQIFQWIQLPGDANSLKRTLHTLRLSDVMVDAVRCVSIQIDDNSSLNLRVFIEAESFQSLAARGAADILRGRSSLINFRENGLPASDRLRLNRHAINAMLLGVGVMLILLSLGLWIRASRYRGVSDRNQQIIMTRFHETLPGWPTPSNFRAVVSSERRRLTPMSNGAATEPTALAMMIRVLQPSPSTSEITFNELSFAAKHFDLAGTLAHYESAQPLSEAIRASGLDVAPVQAHRVSDNSWQFTLSGQTHSPTKAGQP